MPMGHAAESEKSALSAKSQVIDLYNRRPLSFERNDGQTDAHVKYISHGAGYTLFLTPTEAVLTLQKPAKLPGNAKQAFWHRSLRPGQPLLLVARRA